MKWKLNVNVRSVHGVRRTCSLNVLQMTPLNVNQFTSFDIICYTRMIYKPIHIKNMFWKSTSRHLDDLLNIHNPYFEGMVNRIYPSELQLNKANTSDIEAPFLDLHLSISNGLVSSKIYDKRDDFDIVNFPFLDGDVPRSTSYGVYISQLIRIARVSSHVAVFNARNKSLTAKPFQQGYRYHKLRKTFSKILSPALWIRFEIQCLIKITFASRPIGTVIL